MSQRLVKSRVANSGYSVSGSGCEIGYARWEVASRFGKRMRSGARSFFEITPLSVRAKFKRLV
jgi:hypothetical protein